ncbi:DNA-binding protein [Yersinia enterocolitica]|nr:DNA-binding protein [Yersinia enterocolitica]
MKIKIKKDDYYRVLLTDTLPYEVPILFNNDYFHGILQDRELPVKIKNFFFNESIVVTIPYNYRIRKGENSFRTLSIIHPIYQVKICDFYKKYEHVMIHSCTKSPLSLRYPNRVGNYYYEKDFSSNRVSFKEGGVEFNRDGFEVQSQTSSSHFSYKKYPFVYKFYESYEFHRLERKFSKLMKLDISKCFGHIYTHSIFWAVKSKEYAKKNTSYNHFEGLFDKIFQNSNYGETNGILIGPEVSRIFAETIFQRIDLNIINKLSDVFELELEKDYSIRRYVDDFFVFSTDNINLDKIEKVVSTELEKYKLYLNESKKEIMDRPFITGTTIAKSEIRTAVQEIYEQLIDVDKVKIINDEFFSKKKITGDEVDITLLFPLRRIRNKRVEANEFIKSIKMIVKRNSISFDYVSSYLLTALKNKLFKIIKSVSVFEFEENHKNSVIRLFSIFLEVVFFVYSMDNRVRPTYLICQIILEINSFAKKQSGEISEVLKKNVLDEVIISLKGMTRLSDGEQVEFSNLLICLKELGDEYSLSEEYLLSLLNINEECDDELSYFHICSLLYYIGDNVEYKGIMKILTDTIELRMANKDKEFNDCEKTLIFMDSMSCPVLDREFKRKIYRSFFNDSKKKPTPNINIDEIINYFNENVFFFNWYGYTDLEQVLYRKELRTPYE